MKTEFLKWILFIINVLNAILLIIITLAIIALLDILSPNNLRYFNELQSYFDPILWIIIILIIRYPLYQLKQIIKNLMNHDLFTKDNAQRFQKISYPIFLLVISSCFAPFSLIQLELGGIPLKIETFILIILGLVSLLMSYIFEQGRIIHQEATNLKEESKLII